MMETINYHGDSVDYIREKLSQEELLAQLAEECAELGKAALKLCRVLNRRNPTPVKYDVAYRNLLEEIADVSLCLEVLNLNTHTIMRAVRKTMDMKMKRWAMRLEEVECPVCGESINPNARECTNCRVYQHDPDELIGEYEEEND